jgi:hypothetical protein
MDTIFNWLDKEQEHKLIIWEQEQHKNRFNHERKLKNDLAKLDIEFVKMRNAGVKNLHPKMLERLKNVI